ncbi:unnamed protein product [Gordionus sp. m RMFG-2023]
MINICKGSSLRMENYQMEITGDNVCLRSPHTPSDMHFSSSPADGYGCHPETDSTRTHILPPWCNKMPNPFQL